jgi:mRNA interferase MazF
MSKSCAVNCDHLQTVVQARVGALITTLSAERMVEVARAVRFALGF